MWSALCVDAYATPAVNIWPKLPMDEVLMSRNRNRDATVARRIVALKRVMDTSLMELTEVEVLINAQCRRPREGGELEKTRLALTNVIVEMDVELKRLQSSVNRAEQRKVGARSISSLEAGTYRSGT